MRMSWLLHAQLAPDRMELLLRSVGRHKPQIICVTIAIACMAGWGLFRSGHTMLHGQSRLREHAVLSEPPLASTLQVNTWLACSTTRTGHSTTTGPAR
eukprot:4958574-Amphidinium_carterae.1